MKWKVAIAFLLLTNFVFAQNAPTVITAVGDQNFCSQNAMHIVTQVNITDADISDNSLEVVYIQISEGYTSGSDLLSLTGSHPNISANWSANEGRLTLNGPATFNEFISAIEDVTFSTTQTNFTDDKYFSINLGNANYLPSTGHYYFYISDLGITWNAARSAAASLDYFGLQGYLATITSVEEAQLIGGQSRGTGWIGANDAQSEGVWKWVTGPEAGTTFWIGTYNGSPQNGAFTFWNSGEPNNCCGGENYAHITDPSVGPLGSWNDLSDTRNEDPNDPYYPKGYLVEFGGMPGEPEIQVSASTRIITPKLSFEEPVICGEGDVTLNLTSNTSNVIWYETPSSSNPINTGLTYSTFLTSTTTFWILNLLDGCTGGARTPITVTVIGLPSASDVSIVQCDDSVQDGITLFNITNSINVITGGNTSDREVRYFEDETLLNEIDGNLYTNISNPQMLYALVTDTRFGCTNTVEITLEVTTSNTQDAHIEVCDDFVVDGYNFFDLTLADSQVLAGAPNGATVLYYATYQDALLEINTLSNPYFNTQQDYQTIYARVENGDDCYGVSEVSLLVKEIPDLIAYEEVYYCLNTFPETITLSGGVINDLPNNYYYEWSTGENTTTIEVNHVGNYIVLVTEPDGCTNQRDIRVLPSSTATIESIEVSDATYNNTITVTVSGEGEYEYALDDQYGVYQISNTFSNVEAGIHTVYVKDIENDCGTVQKDVSVIGYPKFFTPNGDGINETWQIKGTSAQFQPNTKVFIFDRFGKLLCILNSPMNSWDGRFNGQIVPSADYWFSVSLDDGRIFKGHFTLKR